MSPINLPSRGAVLFAFDDTFIPEWVAALPLFAETGTRATFFVSHPDRVIAEHQAGLRQILAAGHAIGCHGLRHEKAVDAVAQDGIDDYLERDVLPALFHLREAGFQPTAFAYPCSQNDADTDAALLRHFRHLRTGRSPAPGSRLQEMAALFVPGDEVAHRGCLIGTGLDYAGLPQRPDLVAQACEALDRARAQCEVLVLYAHNISETGPGHHIPPVALHQILAHVQTIGLPAITFDDLP
jgi:hypothetical protein